MSVSSRYSWFGLCGVGLFVLLAGLPTVGRADPYTFGFARITANSLVDVASQFFVEVTPEGSNQAGFKFTNAAGIPSSITDIYFDDGALFGIARIESSIGVAFSPGACPRELPGGNVLDPAFETSAGFLADSDAPTSKRGVDAVSEWVKIIFDLLPADDDRPAMTFDDVIDAIARGSTDPSSPWPTLRIGLRAQAIGPSEDSDSFIMTPVPTTILLGVLGLGYAGAKLRKLA
ncbi:MAG: hypothetical protein MUC88_26445 [Planctomycetes bacterium]|jgi:hypothetical protein|nr:hypothetical protein [Planctomycetota bacterium]